MARALVLGGEKGMLGQALVSILNQRDWKVLTAEHRDGDFLNPEFVSHLLETTRPDVVFNTLAWTRVDDAEDHAEEAAQANAILPAVLANCIAKHGKGFLTHYSTDFVFSGDYDHPLDEQFPANPQSVYGRTKLEGEQAVLSRLPDSSCVVRTAWLFGPGKKNFITTILEACSKRDAINVVDDQFGSPTYTLDLACWSALLAEKRQTGLWNGVNSGHASWCELASEAVALGREACRVQPITSEQWPQKARRPAWSVLSNNKLTNFLGFRPRPWPVALRDYLFGFILPEGGQS